MIPGGAQGASDGTDILTLTPDPKLAGLSVGMVVTLGSEPAGRADRPTRHRDHAQRTVPRRHRQGQRPDRRRAPVQRHPQGDGTQPTYVYNIATPQADYAATAIMSLWYSWANYYVAYAANERHATEQMLTGSIDSTQAATNTLTLNDAAPATLVPGTAVSGAGIPDGNCIILKIDGNTLTLSELVTGTGTPSPTNSPRRPSPRWPDMATPWVPPPRGSSSSRSRRPVRRPSISPRPSMRS